MPASRDKSSDEHAPRGKASEALDEALEETFPARDPIALAPVRGGKSDKRVDVVTSADPTGGETTDDKTSANMKAFHKAFERRRR